MIPLFSVSQVRAADEFAINTIGLSGTVLMENAARSLYDEILQNFESINKFLPVGIVCGNGNNGGDGFALARQFIINGYNVITISLADNTKLKGDALINFNVLKKLLNYYKESKLIKYSSLRDLKKLDGCQVIVDALLGTGTMGQLKPPYASIIEKMNEFTAYKVAVDIPSGLDLNNSTGSIVFQADLTVSLAEFKTGLFYGKGYKCSGKVVKGSIGIGQEYFNQLEIQNYLSEPEDALNGVPVRDKDAHKYSAGKVLVIAGSGKMPGAALLAANSTINSGAGAVVLAFPETIKQIAYQKLNEVIVLAYKDEGREYLTSANLEELSEKIEWADALVIGPGLSKNPETLQTCLQIIKKYKNKKIILDADAIQCLSGGLFKKVALNNVIFTPHHGEFAGLLGITTEELQEDILNYGKDFCKKSNVHLVLKGAPTITFTPAGEALINSTGNASLAKFGSGDVLSGMIGGFVGANKEIEKSIISAVYIHGLISDLLIKEKSELSVSASDLIQNITNGIKFISNSII
ncbi:MAG: NAD(P)H-hydrate dehydratase [Bacteroidetes bacterium]|nr:NAD(P)H-hydrate dehydratase [Bacteroidota bacterium]